MLRRRVDTTEAWETVISDPRLRQPDTLSVAADNYLCITANQLHRQADYRQAQDERVKPYVLVRARARADAQPVPLR